MSNIEALKERGNRYFKNEEYRKAIKLYKEGLEIDPTNIPLNCNLAQAYLAVGEFLDAEVHAVVTLAQQEDSVKAVYRAAKAAAMDNKERALGYLTKGLKKYPKSEELRNLHDDIKREKAAADVPRNLCKGKKIMTQGSGGDGSEAIPALDADCEPAAPAAPASKSRSRSACSRPGTLTAGRKDDARSNSVTRTTIEKKKKKRSGPIEIEDLRQDQFLSTLEKLRENLPPTERPRHLREREAMKERKQELLSCMKEGSEAWERGLARKASEKYKTALDIMAESNIEVFGLTEVDRIVLKYSHSFTWIDTLNYNNIVQSVAILTDMELNHATKLPAVYFALGHAFYRLNRFKVALQHLEKGNQVIERNLKITAHPWPGTINIINETTKSGLRESINKLVLNCRTYREPDAVCRYKLCLSISTHISPSEQIFYSDPDYIGFVMVICQQKCKITYHIGCWKDYKEHQSSIGKLSDKDMLGQPCLTSDCLTSNNEISVITRIEVYGDDGNIKTYCAKDPIKVESKKEPKKEKKKKNDKTEKAVQGGARPQPQPQPRPRRLTVNAATQIEKKGKSKFEILSSEFDVRMQQLARKRKFNFGHEQALRWNPKKEYFGRDDIRNLTVFMMPGSMDSDNLREKKNFIFTYFFEFLNDEGPQKISLIESKWQEEVSLFPGINEFMSQHDGICSFLLQSCRFASMDDYLCLPHHLADTNAVAEVELGESLEFIVTRQAAPRALPALAAPLAAAEPAGLWPSGSADVMFFSGSEDSEGSEDGDTDTPTGSGTGSGTVSPAGEPAEQTALSAEPPEHTAAAATGAAGTRNASTQCSQQGAAAASVAPERLDAASQTDEGPDHKQQVDSLKAQVEELQQQIGLYKRVNVSLAAQIEVHLNKCDKITKESEAKFSSLVAQNNKEANDLKLKIAEKVSELAEAKKMHKDQLDKMAKRLEEKTTLLKKNVASMNEMDKQIGKQEATKKLLEEQVRKSNQQQLDIRKTFGEYKLNNYLAKCEERLERMRRVLSNLQDTSSVEYTEIATAIKAWTRVQKELCERKDLLQVQFDILSQQMTSVAHSDSFLQLELGDLPREPADPASELEQAGGCQGAVMLSRAQLLPPVPACAYPASNPAPTPLLGQACNGTMPRARFAPAPAPAPAPASAPAPTPVRPACSMELLPGASVGNSSFPAEKKVASSLYGLIPIEQNNREQNGAAKTIGEVRPPTQKKRWNYQKLLQELHKNFQTISEAELSECLAVVREKNGNKLSGLAIPTIFNLVEKILQEKASKKVGNMGMDKFGVTAWGQVKDRNISWQGENRDGEECIICHVAMAKNQTFLECKHTFHTECIRKWLNTSSTCPICRKYTKLVDEFPPLA